MVYVFENVPESASRFVAVQPTYLGVALKVNALLLGSSVARVTHVWANCAPPTILHHMYNQQLRIGPTLNKLLVKHDFTE